MKKAAGFFFARAIDLFGRFPWLVSFSFSFKKRKLLCGSQCGLHYVGRSAQLVARSLFGCKKKFVTKTLNFNHRYDAFCGKSVLARLTGRITVHIWPYGAFAKHLETHRISCAPLFPLTLASKVKGWRCVLKMSSLLAVYKHYIGQMMSLIFPKFLQCSAIAIRWDTPADTPVLERMRIVCQIARLCTMTATTWTNLFSNALWKKRMRKR